MPFASKSILRRYCLLISSLLKKKSSGKSKNKQQEASLIEGSDAMVKKKRRRPRRIGKNESGVIRIKFLQPICIEKYEDNKQLGRFVLRSNGDTIASGMVLRITKSGSS